MGMGALFITGSWEGALRSDQDGPSVPFSLRQGALDSRLRNNRLIGHWVHRDAEGHVLGTGQLLAERTGSV